MLRLITNPNQIAELKSRSENGELAFLKETVIEVGENDFGLAPGSYYGFEFEEKSTVEPSPQHQPSPS